MAWLTFRLLLGQVIPGAVLVFTAVEMLGSPRIPSISSDSASRILFFLIASTVVGVAIDLIRRTAERLFVQHMNLFWFSNVLRRIERGLTGSAKKVAPLTRFPKLPNPAFALGH